MDDPDDVNRGRIPNPEPRTPGPDLVEEPPPFGRRWTTLYAVVAANLAALIVLFYAFTRVFR